MIMNNVTKFFDKEANAQKLSFLLLQVQKCAAIATGVFLRTVQLIKESESSATFLSTGEFCKPSVERIAVLDSFNLCVLRRRVLKTLNFGEVKEKQNFRRVGGTGRFRGFFFKSKFQRNAEEFHPLIKKEYKN